MKIQLDDIPKINHWYLNASVWLLLHTWATAHVDSIDTCIYEVNLANKHSLGVAGRENGVDA